MSITFLNFIDEVINYEITSVIFIYSHSIAVGEALLNDGMALVLFEALITPEFDTPLKVVYYFLRVIFISPVLGIAFGLGKYVFQRQ